MLLYFLPDSYTSTPRSWRTTRNHMFDSRVGLYSILLLAFSSARPLIFAGVQRAKFGHIYDDARLWAAAVSKWSKISEIQLQPVTDQWLLMCRPNLETFGLRPFKLALPRYFGPHKSDENISLIINKSAVHLRLSSNSAIHRSRLNMPTFIQLVELRRVIK